MLNYKQVKMKREKMSEISYVVVFPSMFSKNKILEKNYQDEMN